jgi:hypothetical protein
MVCTPLWFALGFFFCLVGDNGASWRALAHSHAFAYDTRILGSDDVQFLITVRRYLNYIGGLGAWLRRRLVVFLMSRDDILSCPEK